jgi:formylglycine-generating enzyme required for sulfatase activity
MSDEPTKGASPLATADRGVSPLFSLAQENKLRLQYCGDHSESARGWPVHYRNRNETYETKPVVTVSWQEVETLCQRRSTGQVRYRLPTEAEWEKAAR